MGYKIEDEIVTKDIEVHYIEIPKFIEKNPGTNAKIEQWLWTIVGKEDKVKMAESKNKEVKKAVEILDEMSMSKEERERYEAIQKYEFNYNTGVRNAREIGIQEGEKRKQVEIIMEMLKNNIDIEQIQKITKLTKEEIKKIIKKHR